jgi:hypothetical protein
MQQPLLELPIEDTAYDRYAPPSFPTRSKRIAAQSMAHIPAFKQDEYLVMKRLGLTSGMPSPSMSAMKAYDEMFSGDSSMQALCELFPPDGDVGPRKRRRRHLAAWA